MHSQDPSDPAVREKLRKLREAGMGARAMSINPQEIEEAVRSVKPEVPKGLVAAAVLLATDYLAEGFEFRAKRVIDKHPAIRICEGLAQMTAAHFIVLMSRTTEPHNEALARSIAEHVYALSFASQPTSEDV